MDVSAKDVHLLNGGPAFLIPDLVTRHNIDLVVMGSIARTGIPGMVMGNTAERLLEQVECALLVTKPGGYVSPVTLAEI
ncbi:MAG: hypothetical protein GKR89_35765 [Candidatus Latescibacteria bacterium]|nr:hypothetical protein [Candidatus Latescibacterota bacterium]